MEDSLARKVGEFVIGCMNARQNGTIFLGVLDGRNGSKEHGTIAGVPLARADRHLVAEWMDKYFFAKEPVLFFNASDFSLQALRC
jgi:hypothetical protein